MITARLNRLLNPQTRAGVWRLCALYTSVSVLVAAGFTYFFARANNWDVMDALAPAVLLPLLLAPWMTYSVANTTLRLSETQRELERLTRTDYLTGALNRRGLSEIMAQAFANRRTGRFCVIVLDIDHFKSINDSHGHAGGDIVITHIVEVMRRTLEPGGAEVGRLGGDELGALMPGVTLAQAAAEAERLRSAVEHTSVPHNGPMIHVTTSIGVAELLAEDDSADAMLVRADASLYEAKNGGRNVVRVDFARHAA